MSVSFFSDAIITGLKDHSPLEVPCMKMALEP